MDLQKKVVLSFVGELVLSYAGEEKLPMERFVEALNGMPAFVLFLYIYCFGKIKKTSKADRDDITISKAMVRKKYPHLYDKI